MSHIQNPAGAYGYSTLDDKVKGITVPYKSAETSTTIAKGDAVSMDGSGEILQATTSVDVNLVIGVAAESIAAGKTGNVVILGPALVKAGGTIAAAGVVLARSSSSAGRLDNGTAGAGNGCIAVSLSALDTPTTGFCWAWIGAGQGA